MINTILPSYSSPQILRYESLMHAIMGVSMQSLITQLLVDLKKGAWLSDHT